MINMPSGYTSKIYEGKKVTKEEFILNCARAFGALIDMRDEPLDKEIPKEIKPNPYYLNQKEKMEKELEELQELSPKVIQQLIDEEYEQQVSYRQKRIAELQELKTRYESLLSEVNEWTPPTEEHVNLKDFCIKQLKESIDFDCGSLTRYETQTIEKQNVEQWLSERKESLKKDISYYQTQWEEELQRSKERNDWVQSLYQSLYENQ